MNRHELSVRVKALIDLHYSDAGSPDKFNQWLLEYLTFDINDFEYDTVRVAVLAYVVERGYLL